jgi:hypothetical protein
MKKIPLTQGKHAIVDDKDYAALKKYKWHASASSHNQYYAMTMINGKHKLMHRFILGLKKANIFIDHINHDPLDNRRCNLRITTNSQNQMNRKNFTNKHGYKGILFKTDANRKKKWQAFISKDGEKICLGHYFTKIEAAKAYNEAAKEYFGEYAYLNKV